MRDDDVTNDDNIINIFLAFSGLDYRKINVKRDKLVNIVRINFCFIINIEELVKKIDS